MEKKIKHQIEFAKLSEVENITPTSIQMKVGKNSIVIGIYESKLSETLKESKNNTYFQQKLVLKDIISSDILNRMKHPHILKLEFFDGEIFIWGSLNNPVILVDSSIVDGGTELLLKRDVAESEILT